MNEKIITYINPETGEILKGTGRQIAEKLKISKNTLYRKIKENGEVSHSSVPLKIEVSQPGVTAELPKDLKVGDELEIMATFDIEQVGILQTSVATFDIKPPDPTTDRKPETKRIPPRNPCVKCGQLTYHQINGIFQCFNKCTPPTPKKQPQQPTKEQLAHLHEIIKALSPK